MKKSKYLEAFLAAFLFLLIPPILFGVENLERHVKIVETRTAMAPHLFQGQIFFSYKPEEPVRYVGAAFAHEDFREIHLFQRNEEGIFFLFYPAPEGKNSLDYRLVVDGLWTIDPANPLRFRDSTGVSLSRFELPPSAMQQSLQSPLVHRDKGLVEFVFQAPPGGLVSVVGSFNSWDPYMHRMREITPGLYSLRLRLLPGHYAYAFSAQGRRAPDPLNPRKIYDPEGVAASLLEILR